MDDSTKKKMITRNLTVIKDRISADLDAFVDGLIEKDIIDIDFKEKLKSARTPKERSDNLICMILDKGPEACDEFIKLLRKRGYKDVLMKIDEAVGASGKTDGYNRDRTHDAEDFKEEKGACGGEPTAESSLRPTPSPDLREMEMSLFEVLQSNYKHLQTSYTGLKMQLSDKRKQLYILNQQYVAVRKELEGAKPLSDAYIKLESENIKLKAKIKDLKGRLAIKEDEISKISIKMKEVEIMLSEEKESRERLEKTVNEQSDKLDKQSKLLSTMSEAIQDIKTMVVKNQDQTGTKATQDQGRRQPPFIQGTRTKKNNSHNKYLNKTKGSAKNK